MPPHTCLRRSDPTDRLSSACANDGSVPAQGSSRPIGMQAPNAAE
mgnify:CR=1 FL=1